MTENDKATAAGPICMKLRYTECIDENTLVAISSSWRR